MTKHTTAEHRRREEMRASISVRQQGYLFQKDMVMMLGFSLLQYTDILPITLGIMLSMGGWETSFVSNGQLWHNLNPIMATNSLHAMLYCLRNWKSWELFQVYLDNLGFFKMTYRHISVYASPDMGAWYVLSGVNGLLSSLRLYISNFCLFVSFS